MHMAPSGATPRTMRFVLRALKLLHYRYLRRPALRRVDWHLPQSLVLLLMGHSRWISRACFSLPISHLGDATLMGFVASGCRHTPEGATDQIKTSDFKFWIVDSAKWQKSSRPQECARAGD